MNIIPIKLMVQCPICSELSDADLVESKDCVGCRYKVGMFANVVHCSYPEVLK